MYNWGVKVNGLEALETEPVTLTIQLSFTYLLSETGRLAIYEYDDELYHDESLDNFIYLLWSEALLVLLPLIETLYRIINEFIVITYTF